MHSSEAVRAVAVFEAAKGVLVLVAGFGLLSLLHRDAHALGAQVIAHAHLNPAARYPRIFLDAVDKLSDQRLLMLAAGAGLYASFRLVEAYGLWRARPWAEWLAALSGAVYLPFEAIGLWRDATWLGLGVLLVNALVVAIMADAVRRRRATVG